MAGGLRREVRFKAKELPLGRAFTHSRDGASPSSKSEGSANKSEGSASKSEGSATPPDGPQASPGRVTRALPLILYSNTQTSREYPRHTLTPRVQG